MTGAGGSTGPVRRWLVLPRLAAKAPPRVLIVLGVGVAALGALIVTRPLTSLVLLGVYVGVSAIVSGVVELASAHPSARWWGRAFAVGWILIGLAVLIWLGRSLDLLPPALAILLLLGGVASLGDAVARGAVSRRVLAGAWGGAQLVFGILALTWPDVTVLVVAVVFGVRTAAFGVALVIRGARGLAPQDASETPPPERTRRALVVTATLRWALSVVLIMTAGAGWWLNDWLADGSPVVDAFYDPPRNLPDGAGALIRSDAYLGQAPPNGEVRRILYTTRDANGRRAVASGLVISAREPPSGSRPVVIWNHGTTGVARGCAPSLQDATATKWAIPALDQVLAKGWVVVAPDYTGQGAPGVFPYLIGLGEARSALDAVRAARDLDGLSLGREVAVWGHSQGGHAALWSSQIAPDYAEEFEIVGTAALAPAADPPLMAAEMTRGAGGALLSVLISWVLVPYADTYPDVRLEDYVAPGARSIVREMTQRCPSEPGVMVSVATALGVAEDRPLYVGDLTAGALGSRLRQNAVTGPFPSPLLVVWGTQDEVIPPRLQTAFVEKMCAQDERVRWYAYGGLDHRGVLVPRSPFLSLLVYWTDDRFRDRPAPVDACP